MQVCWSGPANQVDNNLEYLGGYVPRGRDLREAHERADEESVDLVDPMDLWGQRCAV